jgi:acetolactate synthase-1/3 small subunit
MKHKHILSVLVNNSSGVLSHVASLFTRRGYNIESLCVAETHQPERSVITMVIDEDDKMVSQIERQLYKLVDVVKIEDLTNVESVERELVLVSLQSDKSNRDEIVSLINIYQGRVVDMTDTAIMIELIADTHRVHSFINIISEYGIIKIARSGSIALPCLSTNK